MTDASDEDLKPIWGAEDIGKVINRSTRQTFALLEAGELPAKKIGGRWVSTKQKLRRLFEEISA